MHSSKGDGAPSEEDAAAAAAAAGTGGADAKPASKATAASDITKGDMKALWPFIIISITYLLFTVTDGAVRMLVLLHAYNKGFTAMEVAIMFTMYELMGAVTNLVGRCRLTLCNTL
jgi:hypothetical protein